jgi:hypothetical protein
MRIGVDSSENGIRLIVAPWEDRAIVVEEEFPTEFFSLHTLEVGNLIGAILVGKGAVVRQIVMVAHDAHHTIRGFQLTEDRDERLEFAFVERYEVAGEDDGIGLEGVYLINDTEKLVLMAFPAVEVEIRYLNDTETVIGVRKPLAGDCDRLDLMEVSAKEISPYEENQPYAYHAESGIAKRLISYGMMGNKGYCLCHEINQVWE